MRTKARLAVVVSAMCLLVSGITLASAAQLSVQGGGISARTERPCATSVVAAQADAVWWGLGGWNAVDLPLPAACQGSDRVVHVTIYRTSNGTQLVSGTRTGLIATTRVTMNATYGGLFAPEFGITMTIDGWSIPVRF